MTLIEVYSRYQKGKILLPVYLYQWVLPLYFHSQTQVYQKDQAPKCQLLLRN